jgi:translocation and assembly module TamA
MKPSRLARALSLGACLMGATAHAQVADAAQPPAVAPAAEQASIEIEGAGELTALLTRHLDIVRLTIAAKDQNVSDTEWARLIAATPAQTAALLQTEGYFSPVVEVQTLGAAPMKIRVQVALGPRTLVSEFNLDFDGELNTVASSNNVDAVALVRSLKAQWTMKPGDAFRNADWSDAKAETLKRLRSAGYLAARWQRSQADVQVQEHRAVLHLRADSGPLFRSGDIVVSGLKQQNPTTAQFLVGFPPGTPLTEKRLLDAQERLLRSGLYEQVSVTADPDATGAGTAQVLVRLTDQSIQQTTLGLGYSDNSGVRITAEHLHRRAFGRDLTARNKVQLGQDNQAWNGELSTHPDRQMWRWVLGGTVERDKGVNDYVLSQRFRAGRAKDDARIERFYYVEAERSARTANGGRHEALATSMNYHSLWRSLDSLVLPTLGYVLTTNLAAGYSHSATDNSGVFTRAYGRLTGYLPVGANWYGQARIELGQVSAGAGVWVPDSNRFRAGGDDSVRGYGYRSLGPVIDGAVGSGNTVFTTSVELGHPLGVKLPNLWGAVFIDSGDAADRLSQLRPATGIGAGVRWRSPVGPLRLDLAWGDRTKKLRLHVSVGVAF